MVPVPYHRLRSLVVLFKKVEFFFFLNFSNGGSLFPGVVVHMRHLTYRKGILYTTDDNDATFYNKEKEWMEEEEVEINDYYENEENIDELIAEDYGNLKNKTF